MFFRRRRSHDKQCKCLSLCCVFICFASNFLSIMRNNHFRVSLHYFRLLYFILSYPCNQSTVQKSMYLKSILNVLLIIAAVNALLYRSLFDNASKRTKYRFLSRAEDRGENVKGRGFKICQRFIYLIVYYYLYFLERARFMKFVDICAWIKQAKLGYLWWFFQGSRNLLGDEYRRLKYFREKIYQQSLSDLDHGLKNKSKFRAISEQSVSHFRLPSTCITVVFLRRFFCIYDVNFSYDALSFVQWTSRSSVNHVRSVNQENAFKKSSTTNYSLKHAQVK